MSEPLDTWARWLTPYHVSVGQSGRLLRSPAATPSGELFVSEIFGPTVQGEGPHVGRAATFVRLGGCLLDCVWCDTEYSWRLDAAQDTAFAVVPVPDLRTVLAAAVPRRVVVTGGEPLLQRQDVIELAAGLALDGVKIDVETSGTVRLGGLSDVADLVVVSPKLTHSGVSRRRRLKFSVLREYVDGGATFKFVVETLSDIDEIDEIVSALGIEPNHVFVTAQGVRSDVVVRRARAVADAVLARGWGLSPRWHIDLWGDERGR